MDISKFTVSEEIKKQSLSKKDRFRIVSERFNSLSDDEFNKAKSRKDIAKLLGFQEGEMRGLTKVGKIIRDGYLRETLEDTGNGYNQTYYRLKKMPVHIKRNRKTEAEKNYENLSTIQKQARKEVNFTRVVLEIKEVKIILEDTDVKSLVSLIRSLA